MITKVLRCSISDQFWQNSKSEVSGYVSQLKIMRVEKGQKQNDEEEKKGEEEEGEEEEEEDNGDNRVSESVREVLSSAGKCGFPLEKNCGGGFGGGRVVEKNGGGGFGGGMLVEKNGGGGAGFGGGRVVEKNGGAGSPLSQTNGEKEPTIEQMIKKVGREIYDMLPQF